MKSIIYILISNVPSAIIISAVGQVRILFLLARRMDQTFALFALNHLQRIIIDVSLYLSMDICFRLDLVKIRF